MYGKTRAEAAAKLAELINKTAAGVPLAVKGWSVEAYADHWLTDVVGPRLKPATLSSYLATLRLHILPTLGRAKLQTLRPVQVRKLLADKASSGLRPR